MTIAEKAIQYNLFGQKNRGKREQERISLDCHLIAHAPLIDAPIFRGRQLSIDRVLCITQSSSITGTSPSDFLVSYPGYSFVEGSYPSAEEQLVYSTTPANWAITHKGW